MNDCLNKASIKYGEQDTGTQDFLKGLQPTAILPLSRYRFARKPLWNQAFMSADPFYAPFTNFPMM
jgi:hypothetical protein